MALKKILQFSGWPAVSGALLAIVAVLLIQLNGNPANDYGSTSSTNDEQSSSNVIAPIAPVSETNSLEVVSYAEAVKRAAPSVVNIYTTAIRTRRHPLADHPIFRQLFNSSDLLSQQRMQSTLGSGVIVSNQGYILTNYHVISGADEILVQLSDGREARATLVGADQEYDLAVLKINMDNLSTITIGVPSEVEVGDVVLAIGNPFGIGQTVTQGIVSVTSRYGKSTGGVQSYIQTDAAINPGNSGGALIDAYGNLIGINTAIYNDNSSAGISFAIPADVAITVLRDLIEFGRVVRGWLGIEGYPLAMYLAMYPNEAVSLNLDFSNGVLISAVDSDGPAGMAGLQPGDVITRVNDQIISSIDLLILQVQKMRPGDSIEMEIWREGQPQIVTATVEAQPRV